MAEDNLAAMAGAVIILIAVSFLSLAGLLAWHLT